METFLIRALQLIMSLYIFNPEDKIAAGSFGYQIFIKRRAEVADVHITGWAGSKTGTSFHF